MWIIYIIPIYFFNRATDDLESVGELCKATVQCENCGKRQVIDQQVYWESDRFSVLYMAVKCLYAIEDR